MRTTLKFFLAGIVSFFLMVGALGSTGYRSVFLIALAFGVWFLFILSVSASGKKNYR